jgi:HK97 family phage major capsid protein
MLNIANLKAKKAELKAAAESLLNAAIASGNDLKGAELTTYDGKVAEIREIEALINRHAELATFSTEDGGNGSRPNVLPSAEEHISSDVRASAEYNKGFGAYIRSGARQLLATMNITTPADGGYAVPQEWDKNLIEKLVNVNVMRQICDVITTQSDRNFTVENSIGSADWAAESAVSHNDDSSDDDTFSQVVIGSHKLTRIVKVTEELLLDAFFDVQGYLNRKFSNAFGIAEESAFVGGNGSGKPTGVLSGATLGLTAAGAAAITADELLGLYHSLKRAYRANGTFLMNDSTALLIRKLKDTTGQYIWQAGLQAGQPDVLLGKPVAITDFMPNAATGLKSVLFGDFKYYQICDRSSRTFTRLNELYAANGQVGFRGVERTDGKTTLGEAIKYLVQA